MYSVGFAASPVFQFQHHLPQPVGEVVFSSHRIYHAVVTTRLIQRDRYRGTELEENYWWRRIGSKFNREREI